MESAQWGHSLTHSIYQSRRQRSEGKKAARLHPFLVGETLRSCTGRPDASRLRSGDLLVESRIQKGVEVTNPFSVLEDMEVVTIEDRPLPPSPLVSPSKTPAVT
nr:hypothetical protein BaRGS_023739 [Batillaria attramentaria]